MDLAKELKKKKNVELKDLGNANFSWCARNSHRESSEETEGIEHQRKNRDSSDYLIVEIRYNTKKSPGHLWRFAVTQTP